MALKKNPSDLRTKDILENLKSHKQSKERQIQAWTKAKKPTYNGQTLKNLFPKDVTCDEARLPNNMVILHLKIVF